MSATNHVYAPQNTPKHTPQYLITDIDAVELDGERITFHSSTSAVQIFIDQQGLLQKFSHEYFYELRCAKRIKIKRGALASAQADALKESQAFKLHQFSEYKVAKALFYEDVIKELIRVEGKKLPELVDAGYTRKAGFGNKCLAILMPLAESRVKDRWKATRGGTKSIAITLPSPDHFRELIHKYKAANFQAIGIVDLRMGRKAIDYLENAHPDDISLWAEYAERYCDSSKPHITDIALQLKADIYKRNLERELGAREYLEPPAGVLSKMIKAKGRFYLTWKRQGEKAAEMEFNIVHDGLKLDRLGQRVEMDEWHANIQTLLSKAGVWEALPKELKKVIERNKRPWLTVAIDAASRCILAIHFSRYDPSHRSALRALEMVVSDKTLISVVAGTRQPWIYGLVPETLVTDAGAGFRHHRFRASVSTLNALHLFPVTGRPQARGTIESFFSTCDKRFLHYFSGRTFKNIFERGDYDSEKNASLVFDEFCLYLTRAILDIYHQTPQEGLNFATPADLWLRLSHKHKVIPPVSDEERRLIFGTPMKASISDKGIRANGLHYQHRLLQKLRSDDQRLPKRNIKAVEVDYLQDRFNISSLSFFAEGEWHEAVPSIGLPDGITIWEWCGAAAASMATNKANAELRLSIMLPEVNRQRESGEAAMWRSEIGMEAFTPKSLINAQAKFFAKDVIDDRVKKDDALAQYVACKDPLGLPVSSIRDDAKPKDEPDDIIEDNETIAKGRSAFTPFRRRARDDNYKSTES